MIITTVTLITLLLFGSSDHLFFIDKLESGIKQALADDKPRRKELLAELKDAKKRHKAFRKERRRALDTFIEMNGERGTTHEEMSEFFDQIMQQRLEYQREMIGFRLSLSSESATTSGR